MGLAAVRDDELAARKTGFTAKRPAQAWGIGRGPTFSAPTPKAAELCVCPVTLLG